MHDGRLSLRFVSLRDAEALVAIYAPIVTSTAISFETSAPDVAEMRGRIAAQLPDKPWIVAERDGAVAGYAYASTFRGRAAYRFGVEVTAYVAESARRGGIGRAMYGALFALLKLQGYRRAFASITLPNEASVALHLAAGFSEAGVLHAAGFKFDRWHDVAFFERAVAPLHPPQRDPLAVEELEPTNVHAALLAELSSGKRLP
jgi:L-amino acid N-acyltransferase YncA